MKNKSQFLQTAQNATEQQFAEAPVFVEDFAGFNFLPNPFRENTHIFTCLSGEFICESPEEGDRFKHSRVLRPASDEEVKIRRIIISSIDDNGTYQTKECDHLHTLYNDQLGCMQCQVCGAEFGN